MAPLMYAALPTEQFPVPAVDIRQIDPRFWRQDIDYETDEKTGTLVVDAPNKYLYRLRSGGRTTRYGIGVGREGFAWAGRTVVAYKRKWPGWPPPGFHGRAATRAYALSIANGGMDPGLGNPLGARALFTKTVLIPSTVCMAPLRRSRSGRPYLHAAFAFSIRMSSIFTIQSSSVAPSSSFPIRASRHHSWDQHDLRLHPDDPERFTTGGGDTCVGRYS